MTIALDTETTLVSNTEPVPRLVCVSSYGSPYAPLMAADDPEVESLVRYALHRGAAMANAPFDVYVLLRAFPDLLPHIIYAYENDLIYDVLTREKLIDIAEGEHRRRGRYNLGAVAERRAGIELDKNDPWRLRYSELLGVPVTAWPEAARHYALADAAATYAVWREQEAHPHAAQIFIDAGRQARGHIALHAQTLRGIRTDQPRVDEVDRRLITEITEASLVCLDTGLARIRGTKKAPRIVRDTKAAAAMFAPLSDARTETGRVSLSEAALNDAELPPGHPLDAYRRLGALSARRTKNIPVLRRPWIRTRYDECVASGRTSSMAPQGKRRIEDVGPDEWIGTNLQNLQRAGGFRECLVPSPGHVFVISDFKGAELVTLAQVQLDLFGRSALADMLRAGRDPHGEFGRRAFGNLDFKRARQAAKAFNFGKPGGMGRRRFIDYAKNSYGVAITPEEEAACSAEYHRTFPEVRMLFDYVTELEDYDGTITIEQPRSGRIRGGLRFTDACNTHFQGLAADAAKDAMWELWKLDAAVNPDGTVPLRGQCLFVHDENVTVASIDEAPAVLERQEQIMIEAFGRWCPDIPIGVDSVIAERYVKP